LTVFGSVGVSYDAESRQTMVGVAGIVSAFASATPVVGQAISVVSIGLDIYGAGKELAACIN
jgi:hypothetical protein